jgi:2-dehydropantoate 2-reductase
LTFRKVIVLGAGAIGSVLGALLSKKIDVTLIGKKAHVDVVNSIGLTISGDVNETFPIGADTQIQEIPNGTLIFLTTKTYDIERAIGAIRKLLKRDTIILILQNGLGNENLAKRKVGDKAKVLRGITNMAAEFFEAGKVRYWKGETRIEQDPMAEEIANRMKSCGLETSLSKDMNDEVWSKAIVNCVVNPLTAIFRVRNREIAAKSLATVRYQVVQECMRVARAEGARLPKDLTAKIEKEILGYTNYSSMYQDIMKGKKTEIDFLNGKIVELGAKHSIPTPVNEILVHFIEFLEEKNEPSRSN